MQIKMKSMKTIWSSRISANRQVTTICEILDDYFPIYYHILCENMLENNFGQQLYAKCASFQQCCISI